MALYSEMLARMKDPLGSVSSWPRSPWISGAGIERRTPKDRYRWDGMRRGGDRKHPSLVVQYTLEGEGEYREGNRSWSLKAGSLFFAVVPSAHIYCLPARSKDWLFFFLVIEHPFVVRSLTDASRQLAPVNLITADSEPIREMARICTSSARKRFADAFAEEQAILHWCLEVQRWIHSQLHPLDEREALLTRVREMTLRKLPGVATGDEVAAEFGQSRSNFGHRFRRLTGLAPANYMTSLRLEQAAGKLRTTNHSLKEIAAETGFADANLLCRVFRRTYRVTPGRYRKGF